MIDDPQIQVGNRTSGERFQDPAPRDRGHQRHVHRVVPTAYSLVVADLPAALETKEVAVAIDVAQQIVVGSRLC